MILKTVCETTGCLEYSTGNKDLIPAANTHHRPLGVAYVEAKKESLTRVKQHLLLDRLLFYDTLNKENPLTQIGYNLGNNEAKLAK